MVVWSGVWGATWCFGVIFLVCRMGVAIGGIGVVGFMLFGGMGGGDEKVRCFGVIWFGFVVGWGMVGVHLLPNGS